MVHDEVRKYILESAYSIDNTIQDNTLIFKEGYFDSMGFVMLISFLTEKFEISVSDTELVEENFESINAISNFINRKVKC